MSATRYQECPKLPLMKAYAFLEKNGLAADAKQIRHVTVYGPVQSSTHIRRGMVIELLKRNKLLDGFIAECWSCSNKKRQHTRISGYESDYKAYLS